MKTLRIEICENTFWFLIWCLIGISIVTCILVPTYLYNKRLEVIVAAGYEETPGQSVTAIVWKKPSP